jgi:hypothetical protein
LARKATGRGQGESPLIVCVSLSPRRLLCFPIGEAGEGEREVSDDGGSRSSASQGRRRRAPAGLGRAAEAVAALQGRPVWLARGRLGLAWQAGCGGD